MPLSIKVGVHGLGHGGRRVGLFLSGGEHQRMLIAGASLNKPRRLVLDEQSC
jgi:ABC-type transport system involved in Fe-S cluster assembly fused permease/ATPase subunit